MNRKLKSVSLLLATAMLATVAAGCGSNSNDSANSKDNAANAKSNNAANASNASSQSKTPDPVTLNVTLFGNKPSDMDKVVTEFQNRTKDSLNTTLNVSFDVPADYFNKLKLKMAAGEQVDLAFDAPWRDMNSNINKGYYYELDKYFNNDEYPGLKKAFSPEFLEANKVNGHIYAIPITNAFYDVPVILIRKDLREKYGMQPIQSLDDLKVYLDKVKANEPDMVPFGGGRNTWYQTFADFKSKQANFRAYPYEITGTGAMFNVVLSQDGKKVLGATTIGDPAEEWSKLPAPYNNPDFFYGHLDKAVEYRQFLTKDPLAKTQGAAKQAGAIESTLNGVASKRQDLQKTYPNADWEIFVYNDAIRNMEPGAIGTGYKAWNFLVVPKSSKNIDRTMKFLDWMFSNSDNHDLFELGIEGTHWTKDGDTKYKNNGDTSSAYTFPGYELTWNPTLSRINSNNDEATLKYINYEYNQDSYYRLAVSGFNFNPDPVKTEIAKVQPKMDELMPVLYAGIDPNWKQKAESVNKELRSLGLEKIRAELIKQVQAYIDNGGK